MAENQGELNSSDNESGSEDDEVNVTSDEGEIYPVLSTAEYTGQSWLNRGKVPQTLSGSDNSDSDEGSSDSQSEIDEADRVEQEQNKKPISASSYSSLSPTKKDRFWEEDPDIYGIRRSVRSRKEPVRYTVAQDQDDSDDEVQTRKPLPTSSKNKTTTRQQKRRRLSSSDWPTQSSESGSESSDLYSPYQNRSRLVPRANARVPPTGQLRKAATTNRASLLSGAKRNYKDSDDERARISNRKASGNICYKEESDAEETDEDDLIEVSADAVVEYEDDDRETIEKILSTRKGLVSWTGAKTTMYSSEYQEMLIKVATNPDNAETTEQYLIKWKGWSHLHNTWESKETLSLQNVKGMKKLENLLKRKDEIQRWKKYAVPEDVEYFECQEQMNLDLYEEYQQVERIIAHNNVKTVDETGNVSNQVDYLCKWMGLPYSEASWEDGPLISKIGFQAQIDSYLKRERCDKVPSKNERFPKQKPKFIPHKKQPSFIAKCSKMELRDYQLGGLNFLSHSWSKENSVILADEMGLGKTIQSIAFLANLINTYSVWGPFLLVVPLSTIAAWQHEFSLWAPEINLVVYLGDAVSRKKIQEFEFYHSTLKNRLKLNALLTTYEILLKDKDVLKVFNWSALLVDEAHRLKNDDSLLYKVLFDFNTHHRVLVTGTPLQNSLKELWSLLHFIMPNRFSSWEEFEEKHATTEERDSGFSSLHKEIEPFLFRRVKKDVEKSLPAKVEQILRVEMSSIQKQYYRWILTKNFKMLNKGMKGNSNTFLNIVMELKKCCNHAALIRPLDELADLQAILHGSGKLMLLDKLLCRLKETGHRVLIFSQMVRMLDILADYLQRRRFNFQRLDGSIRGDLRKKALDRFNAEGSEDFCFLLSTRAGGLGINLATADTVIIFDSDWNPQNDLQAQARAHRIGQKNQVNIYRLVTKGSVEEDIVERAKKKMVLDHLIIQRMDTTGRKVLSKTNTAPSTNTPFNKDELSAILKFGAEDLFKDGDGERDKELQEMDIDEILKRAETRESDDQPSTMGEELLSQFKVADFVSMNFEEEPQIEESEAKGDEKSWDDIIPDTERKILAEEEEQQKQLELYLPRRPRKSVKKMNIGHPGQEENKPKTKRKRKATSSSGDDFEDDGKGSKKKRGRPRTVKREDIEGFSDQEIRRFIKSYKKFGRPLTRLDVIAIDAELEEKSKEDIAKLANALRDGCVKEIKDYDEKLSQDPTFDGKKRGASLRLSGVSVNAPSLLKHESELEPLADAIPMDPEARKKYRFTTPAKSVHWDVEWEVTDDSMLLVGVYEHGLGSWETIKADPKLSLSKILPPGNLKPQDKHLQTRAEYLVRLLKQEGIRSKAESLRESSEKIRLKIEKLEKMKTEKKTVPKKKETKEKKVKAKKKPANQESVQTSGLEKGYPQMTSPLASENIKQEHIEEDSKSEEKNEKPKKVKKKVEKGNSVKPKDKKGAEVEENKASHVPMHVLADMDQITFGVCKEKMRPVKRSLKLLENTGDTLTESEHVEQTRQCLLKIGDHIMSTTDIEEPEIASDGRSTLWSFVAKFTALDAKKLCKVYKHACKKRDEDRKNKEQSKKDGLKTHKLSSQKRPSDSGAGHHDNKQARLSANAGSHGSWAHTSRPRDHHENSWRGGSRDNTRDSHGNRPSWRNEQHYNENRSSHPDRYSNEKFRRDDPKNHDDSFRSRTSQYRDNRPHNPRDVQQASGKSDPRMGKHYHRDLDRHEGSSTHHHSSINRHDYRSDTEHNPRS